jgi:DNA-binding GntR family transcriptional regulator
MPLKRLRLSSATAQAVEALRAALANGEYEPGTRLFEESIANEFGISRIPVREALAMLVAQGLLERRQRSVLVPALNSAEVEELYLGRAALESLLYDRAGPRIRDVDVAKLERAEAALEAAASNSSLKDLALHNRSFHFTILERGGLPMICDMVGQLWDRTSYYRAYFWLEESHRRVTIEEHRLIIDACKARNGNALVELHHQHRLEMERAHPRWLASHSAVQGKQGADESHDRRVGRQTVRG